MSYSVAIIGRSQSKKNKVNLALRIIIDRKVKVYAIGKSIDKICWDPVKGEVNKQYGNFKQMNTLLHSIKLKAERILFDMELNNESITLNTFAKKYEDQSAKYTFYDYAKKMIDKQKDSVSNEYYKQIYSIINKVRDFEDIRLKDHTGDWIDRYKTHLKQKGNSQNTISNNLKRIHYFIKLALKHGIIKEDPFAFTVLKWQKSTRDILTIDDLKKLEQTIDQMPDPIKRSIKMFLFGLYNGGLRYQSLVALKWNEIRSDGIYHIQHKTGNPVFIPWTRLGKRHLPANRQDNNLVFESISEQKHRDYVKVGCFLAGINKKITLRTARHTFISISIAIGMNIKHTSELAGHSSVKQTENYHHLNSDVLKDQINFWDNLDI